MYKIAIFGKARSGKDTTAKLIMKRLGSGKHKKMAFADPIKEMLLTMFPFISKECVYGPSELRDTIIPGYVDSNGNQLTIRRALIDLGSSGRLYDNKIWVNIFNHRVNNLKKSVKSITVSDGRFINEFDSLKENGFYMIRILRQDHAKIDDESEKNQDGIPNSSFDSIIINDSGLSELKSIVKGIVKKIKKPIK